MRTRSSRTGIALIVGLFFLSSCGATKLSEPWVNSAHEGRYLKNVLVVSISDQFEKKKLEDIFAAQFQKHGVKAVSLAATTQEKELTSAEVKAEAARLSTDAIFTIRTVSIGEKEVTERYDLPPETSPDWSFNLPIYNAQPPVEYMMAEKDIVMEFNLYDAETAKLMWKVRSETIKAGATAKLIDEASRKVMKDLSASRLIR
ncbi:MAG: hypothetical protein ACXWMC_08740 [Syntrophales bacterium]